MPPPPPTRDDLEAEGRDVAAMLGEGWSARVDGHVVVLVGPGDEEYRHYFGSAYWRRLVEVARERKPGRAKESVW